MLRKGQVEIIVVFAVILIALVAILIFFLGFGQEIKGSGLGEEIKLIKHSTGEMLKKGLDNVLLKIYMNGGYYDTESLGENEKIEYKRRNIAVLQQCDSYKIPNFENEIRKGLIDFIKGRISEHMQFFGKDVQFYIDRMEVNIYIREGEVEANVYLPASIEGRDIDPTYTIVKSSNLLAIKEFLETFLKTLSESRFFEVVTLVSMFHSNPYSQYYTPFSDILLQGEVFSKSKEEVTESISSILEYTAQHIIFNKNDVLRFAENPFYIVDTISGEHFSLDIFVDYPNEWNSKLIENLKTIPEPLIIRPPSVSKIAVVDTLLSKIFPIPRAKIYSVIYSFKNPFVISIKDDVMNEHFRFAVFSVIDSNIPASNCDITFQPEIDYEEVCNKRAKCLLSLKVVNESGDGIENAVVFFDKCILGRTDSEGEIKANAPCFLGELKIYKPRYMTYGNLTTIRLINNTKVVMKRMIENATFNFFAVPVLAAGKVDDGDYSIYAAILPIPFSVLDMDNDMKNDFFTNINFVPIKRNPVSGEPRTFSISNLNLSSNKSKDYEIIDYVAPGVYEINGTVHWNDDMEKMYIYLNQIFEIKSNRTCFYIPVVYDIESDSLVRVDKLLYTEIEELLYALNSIGIPNFVDDCRQLELVRYGDDSFAIEYCDDDVCIQENMCTNVGCESKGCNSIWSDNEDVYLDVNWKPSTPDVVKASGSVFGFENEPHADSETLRLSAIIINTVERNIVINASKIDDSLAVFLDGVRIDNKGCLGMNKSKTCGGLMQPCACHLFQNFMCENMCLSEEVCDSINITINPGIHRISFYLFNINLGTSSGNFIGMTLKAVEPQVNNFYELFDVMNSKKWW